jgi:hypothetical protein
VALIQSTVSSFQHTSTHIKSCTEHNFLELRDPSAMSSSGAMGKVCFLHDAGEHGLGSDPGVIEAGRDYQQAAVYQRLCDIPGRTTSDDERPLGEQWASETLNSQEGIRESKRLGANGDISAIYTHRDWLHDRPSV